MSQETPTYKIRLVMCTGTEGVWIEEVPGGKNWVEGSGCGFGALANETINGAVWFLTKDFLKEYAWETNQDGSYLCEGQFRRLWNEFAAPRFCQNRQRCKGCCAALPGDTIFWKEGTSYTYVPATPEQLEQRGWLATGPGGLLFAQARLARDDPSQLED